MEGGGRVGDGDAIITVPVSVRPCKSSGDNHRNQNEAREGRVPTISSVPLLRPLCQEK